MILYFCNEAVLELHKLHSMIDLTRQCLELRTEDGVELHFVIERARPGAAVALAASVEASLAERRRSVRGFELVSVTEREYPDVTGVEARMTYIDRDRGPLFAYELHSILDGTRITFQGSSRVAHATACDEWMQTTLRHLKLR